MHTAKAEALEGPPQGARNGLPEGRFPHTGWTDKTQDRRIRRGVELEHTEVLEDTLLDLLEIEVILIEYLASPRQIQLVDGALAPGQFENQVEIGPDNVIIGRRFRQMLHAREFAFSLFADGLGQIGLLQ